MIPLLLLAGAAARDLPGTAHPDHPFDITHLDLAVRVDIDNRSVAGTASFDMQRLGRATSHLRLHQQGLAIHKVTVDGKPTTYRVAPDRLDIDVPVDREALHVEITYDAPAPVTGMHFRGGPNDPKGEARVAWTQGEAQDNRHWFPGWDELGDRFTVATHVEVPARDNAFALGVLTQKVALDDGWVRWSYAQEEPVVNYLVTVVAGDLHETSMSGSLTQIAPPTMPAEASRAMLAPTADQLRYFEAALDEPFPYPAYRQVIVPRFLYGGMENPGLVVLGDHYALHHPDQDPRRVHQVIAHELAHQWFGDLLTCYTWRDLWLNEGFATYWAGRWQEEDLGSAEYAALIHRWHKGALRGDSPMAPVGWTQGDAADNARVYVHGASFLRMLEVYLGRSVFDRATQQWVHTHRGENVESSQLRRTFEDVSGRDLGPWFDAFVHDAGHASFTTTWDWDADERQVRVTLEQTGDREPIGVPVEVAISTSDGERVERVWAYAGTTTIVRGLDAAPAYVAIDPRGGVLAHWTHTQSAEQWAAQAKHANEPFARLTALEQLGEVADQVSLDTLSQVLTDPTQPDALRREAASALGKLPSQTATKALVQALDDAPNSVRSEIYVALGTQKEHAPIERLLREARGSSWPVQIEALEALTVAAPDRAGAEARRWLSSPDRTVDRELHAAALHALGDVGTSSDLRLLLPTLTNATPPTVLSRAIAAATRLAGSADDTNASRALVVSKLEALLASNDLRIQRRAIGALGQIGTQDSASLLMAYASRPQGSGNAEYARTTAKTIRARKAPAQIPSEDLKDLEARLKALNDRVERLEQHGSE